MFTRLKTLFPLNTARPAADSKSCKVEGDQHLKSDRLLEAAECYRRSIAISPDYLDACIGLGFVLSQQQQYYEAERHLRHALSLDSGNADVHYVLGTIANQRNDHAGAIEHFARALEIKPDFVFAYRDLFAVLLQTSRYAQAKDVLHKAISVYPQLAEFQFHLGNVLSQERDYDGAIVC